MAGNSLASQVVSHGVIEPEHSGPTRTDSESGGVHGFSSCQCTLATGRGDLRAPGRGRLGILALFWDFAVYSCVTVTDQAPTLMISGPGPRGFKVESLVKTRNRAQVD
jgi:hypothetical protein